MSYQNPADQFRDAIDKMGGIDPQVPPATSCDSWQQQIVPEVLEMTIDSDDLPPIIPPGTQPTIVIPVPLVMGSGSEVVLVLGMPPGYPHAVRVAGTKVREFPNGERGLMILISTARPTWFQRAADWLWRRFAGV